MTTKRTPRKGAGKGRAPQQPPPLPEFPNDIRLTDEEAEALAKHIARGTPMLDEEGDTLSLLLLLTALTYTDDVVDRESILGAFRREAYPLLVSIDEAAGASVVARYDRLRRQVAEKGGVE